MNEPLEFVIGEGAVIGGFEVGLQDMCIGEVRHLTVPTKFAYGTNGLGNMPSRVTLYFFVKLLSFETLKEGAHKPNTFKSIDSNDDQLLSPDEVRCYGSFSYFLFTVKNNYKNGYIKKSIHFIYWPYSNLFLG